MKRNFFLIIFLLSSYTFSMEHPDLISFIVNNQSLTITQQQFISISTFNNLLELELESDLIIDNPYINTDHLKLLLNYDTDISSDLDPSLIIPLVNLADYLGFKHETVSRLAEESKKLPEDMQPHDETSRIAQNSIQTLLNRGMTADDVVTSLYDEVEGNKVVLDLSSLKLDSLEGIEKLLKMTDQHITEINLDNNPLFFLDIDKLITLCSFLHKISARNCIIKELQCPPELPDKFILDMSGCRIDEAPSLKAGEGSSLIIDNVTLNPITLRRFKEAGHTPIRLRHRAFFTTLYDTLGYTDNFFLKFISNHAPGTPLRGAPTLIGLLTTSLCTIKIAQLVSGKKYDNNNTMINSKIPIVGVLELVHKLCDTFLEAPKSTLIKKRVGLLLIPPLVIGSGYCFKKLYCHYKATAQNNSNLAYKAPSVLMRNVKIKKNSSQSYIQKLTNPIKQAFDCYRLRYL